MELLKHMTEALFERRKKDLLGQHIELNSVARVDSRKFKVKISRSTDAFTTQKIEKENATRVLSTINDCLLGFRPYLTDDEEDLLVDLQTSFRMYGTQYLRVPQRCRYCARTTTHMIRGGFQCNNHPRRQPAQFLVQRATSAGAEEIVRRSDHPRATEVLGALRVARNRMAAEMNFGEKLLFKTKSGRQKDKAEKFIEDIAGRAWDEMVRILQNARARELGWGLEATHDAQKRKLDYDFEQGILNRAQFLQKNDELACQIAERESRDMAFQIQAQEIGGPTTQKTWWAHPAQAVARKQVLGDLYEIFSLKPRISRDRLKEALEAIARGMPQKRAAELYRVSPRTLR